MSRFSPRRRPLFLLTPLVLLAWACEVPGVTPLEVEPVIASNSAKGSGDGQSARAGTQVATAPSLTITDQTGRPMRGVTVGFSVSTGSVGNSSVTTGETGVASAGSWTLGCTTGTQTLTASPSGLSPVNFTATATAPSPANLTKVATTDNQSAVVNTAVANAPSVTVRDASNNPVPCVTVNFTTGSSSGTLTSASQVTNGLGVATVGSWTLGTGAGTQVVNATVAGTSLTASFTATANPGPAATVAVVSGQSATVTGFTNTNVSPTPAVIVRDQFGNNVAGNVVTWSIPSGGGTIGTPVAVSTATNGVSTSPSWTLGSTAGTYLLRATATGTGITGNPLTFTATASPQHSATHNAGNNQTAGLNQEVAVQPSIIVRDAANAPVAGVSVTFAITGGGGAVGGSSPLTQTSFTTTTNSSGIASTRWKLGPTAGTNNNTLSASCASCSTSPQFTASAVSGNTLVITGGNNQSAQVGSGPTAAAEVTVRDPSGNPLSGVTVTWTVTAGGGTVNGSSSSSIATNASGVSSVGAGWIFGTTAGAQTMTATVSGITTVPQTVTFNGTATAGPPTQLSKHSGDNQSAPAGSAHPSPPTVLVRDAHGNPVSGVVVTFAVASGGGSVVQGSSATTNAAGLASPQSWTLGSTPGTNTLTAAVSGLPTLTFTATGTAVPASISANSATSQSANAGTAVTAPPSVVVRDASNTALAGVTVTFAITQGGGSITGSNTVVTNASGVATVGGWTLGSATGANTMTATIAGTGITGNPVTFNATAIDPCSASPISINAAQTVNGTLQTGDCAANGGFLMDRYRLVMPSALAVTVTMSASAYTPMLDFEDPFLFTISNSVTTTARFYLASGSYDFFATSSTAGQSGSYTVATSMGVTQTGCNLIDVMRNVTISDRSLSSSDCPSYTITNTSGGSSTPVAGTRYAEPFVIRLVAGQAVTFDMTACAFDSYIELRQGLTATSTSVGADDDSGVDACSRLTYTPTQTGFYTLWVTTFSPPGVGSGNGGTYTLFIAP